MLTSLIAMMALLLSTGVSHFARPAPDVDTAAAADNPLYKPEDPSTMTLALIGAGTLAVYFGSRRGLRARRTIARGEREGEHFEPLSPEVNESAEKPSRGAA